MTDVLIRVIYSYAVSRQRRFYFGKVLRKPEETLNLARSVAFICFLNSVKLDRGIACMYKMSAPVLQLLTTPSIEASALRLLPCCVCSENA